MGLSLNVCDAPGWQHRLVPLHPPVLMTLSTNVGTHQLLTPGKAWA
jgi:hypothetical protein